MKKTLSLLIAAAIAVVPFFATTGAVADENDDIINIAVSDNFDDCNILTATKHSTSSDWIYTMAYDRLFGEIRTVIDENGKKYKQFTPELALDWEFYDIEYSEGEVPPDRPIYDVDFDIPVIESISAGDVWEEYIPGLSEGVNDMFTSDLEFLNYPDVLGISISLREDIYFSDGTPFTPESICNLWLYAIRNSGTLISKFWSHVFKIEIIDEYKVGIGLTFNDPSYGFMDWMQELTSPIASIVMPTYDNEFPVGTGAYNISSFERNNYVLLEKNENWWRGYVPSEKIKFIYYSVYNDQVNDFNEKKIDFTMISDYDEERVFVAHETYRIANNPLVCTFNTDNDYLSNIDIRKAMHTIFYTQDYFSLFPYSLTDVSNDYWAKSCSTNFLLTQEDVNRILDSMMMPDERIQLNMIVSTNDTICVDLAYSLQFIVGYSTDKIEIKIEFLSNESYRQRLIEKDYDLALGYVDLNDIDSAYNALYGSNVSNLNKILNAAKISADLSTFWTVQRYAQIENHNNVILDIFGWKVNKYVQSSNVSGIKICGVPAFGGSSTYYPKLSGGPNCKSDIGHIDFRWIKRI